MRFFITLFLGLSVLITSCASSTNGNEPPLVTIAKPEMTTPDRFNPADQEACLAFGGDYRQDGLAGYYQCTLSFSDAGQACSDASDCMGDCRLYDTKDYDFNSIGVVGVCQATDSPFGCYSSVMDGRMTAMLCVD